MQKSIKNFKGSDIQHLQSLLDQWSLIEQSFSSNSWIIDSNQGDYKIDFEYIEKIFDLSIEERFELTITIKILLLESTKGMVNIAMYRNIYNALLKTFYFFKSNDIKCINKKELVKYFNYILMTRNDLGVLVPVSQPLVLKPISFDLVKWNRLLKFNNQPTIIDSSVNSKTMQEAIEVSVDFLSSGKLSFHDWRYGNNFDKLTLDYGMYYVDYCLDFFSDHILEAIAISQTIKRTHLISKSMRSRNITNQSENLSVNYGLIGNFLQGLRVEDLPNSYLEKHSKDYLNKLKDLTLREFRSIYSSYKIREDCLKDKNIDKLISRLNLPSTLLSKGGVKEIVWHVLFLRKNISGIEEIVKIAFSGKVETSKFIMEIDNLLSEQSVYEKVSPSHINFLKDIGLVSRSSNTYFFYSLVSATENAGITSILALTGWRSSEYGFSLSDINVTANEDILDRVHNPIRYQVKWVVPKTSKKVPIKREINRNIYSMIWFLSELNGSGDTLPAIYSFQKTRKINFLESSESIKFSVKALWPQFVYHYKPFKMLDGLDKLNTLQNQSKKRALTVSENERLENLKATCLEQDWHSLANSKRLVQSMKRARNEIERLEFGLFRTKNRDFIKRWRNGSLEKKYKYMLKKHLSAETLLEITNTDEQSNSNGYLSRTVLEELKQGTLYPTSHAFRHMWAEAVYRRYDGDVGWAIRSNFVHINQNMWLAYIRNKDGQNSNITVKANVISSIVSNYVDKKGEGYAGGLHKTLRRLLLSTRVIKNEQLEEIAVRFARDEIVDIKTTPFGFCLLQRRVQSKAKCSVNGVPNRYLASPDLCFSCGNSLAMQSNIEGILLSTANDLKVIRTENIPELFKNKSKETIVKALIYLKELDADEEILEEYEKILKL